MLYISPLFFQIENSFLKFSISPSLPPAATANVPLHLIIVVIWTLSGPLAAGGSGNPSIYYLNYTLWGDECFSVVWCGPELLLLSLPPSGSPAFFLLSLWDDIAWWLRVWALAPTAWLAQLVLLLTNLCDNDWLLELSVPPFPTMRTKIMLISCKDQLF